MATFLAKQIVLVAILLLGFVVDFNEASSLLGDASSLKGITATAEGEPQNLLERSMMRTADDPSASMDDVDFPAAPEEGGRPVSEIMDDIKEDDENGGEDGGDEDEEDEDEEDEDEGDEEKGEDEGKEGEDEGDENESDENESDEDEGDEDEDDDDEEGGTEEEGGTAKAAKEDTGDEEEGATEETDEDEEEGGTEEDEEEDEDRSAKRKASKRKGKASKRKASKAKDEEDDATEETGEEDEDNEEGDEEDKKAERKRVSKILTKVENKADKITKRMSGTLPENMKPRFFDKLKLKAKELADKLREVKDTVEKENENSATQSPLKNRYDCVKATIKNVRDDISNQEEVWRSQGVPVRGMYRTRA